MGGISKYDMTAKKCHGSQEGIAKFYWHHVHQSKEYLFETVKQLEENIWKSQQLHTGACSFARGLIQFHHKAKFLLFVLYQFLVALLKIFDLTLELIIPDIKISKQIFNEETWSQNINRCVSHLHGLLEMHRKNNNTTVCQMPHVSTCMEC